MAKQEPIPMGLVSRRPQGGAVSLMAVLWMGCLVGMAALAVDAARMWIVHQELKSAAQACALAAVVELDGGAGSARRAAAVGAHIGGLRNRKNLQTTPVALSGSDVQFGASAQGPWLAAASPGADAATHVRCTGREPSLALALASVLGLPQTVVRAQAIAGLLPGQTSCPLPLALCAGRVSQAGNTFGLLPGQLIRADFSALGIAGFFRWVNVNSSTGGAGLETLRSALVGRGTCSTDTALRKCIGVETGNIATLANEWNTRFGVYKSGQGHYTPEQAPPAFSGRGYGSDWCNPLSRQNYLDLGLVNTAGVSIELCSSFEQRYRAVDEPARAPHSGAIPGYRVDAQAHVSLGRNGRRLAVVPVVDCGPDATRTCGSRSLPVVGWACVFLRAAVRSTGIPEVEFVGRADNPLTGCRGFGVAGRIDSGAPLVATLLE